MKGSKHKGNKDLNKEHQVYKLWHKHRGSKLEEYQHQLKHEFKEMDISFKKKRCYILHSEKGRIYS